MKYNHGNARKKFMKEWETLRIEYAEAGMSPDAIQQIYEFDYQHFKKERVFCEHNDYITETLLQSVHVSSTTTSFDSSRYGWIQELDDIPLLERIKTLTPKQIELITLYVFDNLKLVEIAKLQGISHVALSQQLATIKKKLKIF